MRLRDTKKEVASIRGGLRMEGPKARVAGPMTETAFVSMELTGDLDGWRVEATFSLDEGDVVHGPVTFTPGGRAPFGSLTARAMRQLSLHEALAAMEDVLRNIDAQTPGEPKIARPWVDALTAGRRPGSRGHDRSVYLLWAQRRVAAEEAAPKRPIKWMVEQWGDTYDEAAINKKVSQARDKGFLSPAGQPVSLTPQAKRLLKGAGDGKR